MAENSEDTVNSENAEDDSAADGEISTENSDADLEAAEDNFAPNGEIAEDKSNTDAEDVAENSDETASLRDETSEDAADSGDATENVKVFTDTNTSEEASDKDITDDQGEYSVKEEDTQSAPGANAVGLTLMMSRSVIPAYVATDVEEITEESDALESAVGFAASLF